MCSCYVNGLGFGAIYKVDGVPNLRVEVERLHTNVYLRKPIELHVHAVDCSFV